MALPNIKGLLKSRRIRVILALAIILIFVVLSFFGPHDEESDNVTGDTLPATVTVTSPLSTLSVNRSIDYSNVDITVTKVDEAAAFSDDKKQGGAYVIRVYLQEKSAATQSPVGIDYPSLTRLLLPNGESIAPKFVAIAPSVLPDSVQSGFIDFPVAAPVTLSSLALRMGNGTSVAFSG